MRKKNISKFNLSRENRKKNIIKLQINKNLDWIRRRKKLSSDSHKIFINSLSFFVIQRNFEIHMRIHSFIFMTCISMFISNAKSNENEIESRINDKKHTHTLIHKNEINFTLLSSFLSLVLKNLWTCCNIQYQNTLLLFVLIIT